MDNQENGQTGIGDLGGRVAIITGAGSGIGLSISRCLSAAGAHVIGFDLDGQSRSAFKRAASPTASTDFVEIDICDRNAVQAAVTKVRNSTDRIDVLVNSAGIRDIGGALDLSPEEWQRVIDVNLSGTFHCCSAVAPTMLHQGRGSIVNIASIAGMFGFKQRTAYTVTKHGVIGLTRTLAAQFGPNGVRVNAICPGLISTPLTSSLVTDPQVQHSFRILVPFGRAGTPDEIADVALFLAGDGARFVTGVALPVDGGYSVLATYDATGQSEEFERRFSVLGQDSQ